MPVEAIKAVAVVGAGLVHRPVEAQRVAVAGRPGRGLSTHLKVNQIISKCQYEDESL